MRLSELMSEMDLATYPQVALVIFLVVFAAVCLRTFSKKRRATYEQIARIPLADQPVDDRADPPSDHHETRGAER